MSEESANPDLVPLARRLVEASNRRDFDAVESFYAPDCLLRGAEIGEFEGQAAARGVVEDMAAPFEDFHIDIEEVLDLVRGVTFAVVVARGRVGGGSAEVQFRFATVATWKKDLVERQFNFIDIDEARAAAERLVEERSP
jgi:ketosteroid isomerase-like protein